MSSGRSLIARAIACALCLLCAILTASPAAADELRAGGKLVLTDGITSVEGSAGGGLSTWALIAGNETDAGIGGTTHVSHVALPDFDLTSFGGAIGYRNRVEISYAHQDFDTRRFGAKLGLGRGYTFSQDIVGVKLRLVGDAVYDQDRILPQIAIGLQYKRANRGAVIAAVGGKASSGVDFYVSATKVILSRGLVLGGSVRLTRANQFGLLGFGGDRSSGYRPQVEASVGKLIKRNLLIGVEYRMKPDNLRFAREDDAHDVFVAWGVTRNVKLTAAYVDLGSIATSRKQRGLFASTQAGF